jgi:DNA-binding CsgD family transcriptional regulator
VSLRPDSDAPVIPLYPGPSPEGGRLVLVVSVDHGGDTAVTAQWADDSGRPCTWSSTGELDEEWVAVAREVARGIGRHARSMAEQAGAAGGAAGNAGALLTPAEWRVLMLLPTHLTLGEIAESLYVSRNTVKTQAVTVYRKLGVSGRSQAVGRARALGYLAG